MRTFAGRLAAAVVGVPAEKLALMIAMGIVLGTFPVPACPTVLCAAAAFAFRLNLPALQMMNQIVTPAQVALMLPFARLGRSAIGSYGGFAGAAAHAVAGWFCFAVPAGMILYLALMLLQTRWSAAATNRREEFNLKEMAAARLAA